MVCPFICKIIKIIQCFIILTKLIHCINVFQDKSLDVEDHMGNPLDAMEVFSKSIEYLKEKFWESLRSKKIEISEKDVHWVVTIPAIWDEFSKKFMRKSAEKVQNCNCTSICIYIGAPSVSFFHMKDIFSFQKPKYAALFGTCVMFL